MEEYEIYTRIQRHIDISTRLYELDQHGKHLLNELSRTKNTRQSKRSTTFTKDISIIYDAVSDTINVRRFKSRLYLTLLYYLDEALFNNITEDQERFFIEDDSYDLTKLYFDQQSWIRFHGVQQYQMIGNNDLNIEDALLIRCFFTSFDKLLSDIENLDIIPDKTKYKTKIKNVIAKIRTKHCSAIDIIDKCIMNDADNADSIFDSGEKN